jgi:hypothetical protein
VVLVEERSRIEARLQDLGPAISSFYAHAPELVGRCCSAWELAAHTDDRNWLRCCLVATRLNGAAGAVDTIRIVRLPHGLTTKALGRILGFQCVSGLGSCCDCNDKLFYRRDLDSFFHLSPSYEDFFGQHELIRWAGHSV